MTQQEALDVLNKKSRLKDKRFKDRQKKWEDVYYGISLHTTGACPYFQLPMTRGYYYPHGWVCNEYQVLFDYHLMNKHPNEKEESRWYRYSIYRPLTKAPFTRAIQVLSGALFQDSNYSVIIPDKKDEEYINSNIFHGHDLMGYFANVGIKHIIEDPNGLFVRMPVKPWDEQESDRVEVGVFFVQSRHIILLNEDVLFYKDENDYAYLIDKQAIWRFRQGEDKKWVLADNEGYYSHMLGYLPITVAGGEWNTHGYYDSYMDNAKALCDDFISSYSSAQVVDKEASHPFIQVVQTDCPDCQATGWIAGVCRTCDMGADLCKCEGEDYLRFGKRKCGSCGGRGTQSRNPMDWIVVPKEDADKNVDYLKYISPDIGINKHHREVVKELYEQILQSLHLYRTDKAESGAAKAIDQEWLYQFLSKVSNHVFDKVVSDTIRDFIAYRNVRSGEDGVVRPFVYDFTIIKPNQFNIKTPNDLLEDYKQGKEAGLPLVLRDRMAQDFADKAYWGDSILQKKLAVQSAIDPNYAYSIEELASLQVMGAIVREDAIYTVMLPKYLNQIIEDKGKPWFLQATPEDIKKEVDALMPKPNPLTDGLPPSEERTEVIV